MTTRPYIVRDGQVGEMTPKRAVDERIELQGILEANPHLIPGEQIDPKEPPRWILIGREVPIKEAERGTNRWGVDFLFGDHRAVPTFVECKLRDSTESRRKVVGQVLEYVANAVHTFEPDFIESKLRATHKGDADAVFARLGSNDASSLTDYASALVQNLRARRVRVVFFLDDAPSELKAIAGFLHSLSASFEVFVVSASIYENGGTRILLPRVVNMKSGLAVRSDASVPVPEPAAKSAGREWNRQSFFEDAKRNSLDARIVDAMNFFLDNAPKSGFEIRWGSGKTYGSFGLVFEAICVRSIFTISSKGTFWWNFGWLNLSPDEARLRDEIASYSERQLGLKLKPDSFTRFPSVETSVWVSNHREILAELTRLVKTISDEASREDDATPKSN